MAGERVRRLVTSFSSSNEAAGARTARSILAELQKTKQTTSGSPQGPAPGMSIPLPSTAAPHQPLSASASSSSRASSSSSPLPSSSPSLIQAASASTSSASAEAAPSSPTLAPTSSSPLTREGNAARKDAGDAVPMIVAYSDLWDGIDPCLEQAHGTKLSTKDIATGLGQWAAAEKDYISKLPFTRKRYELPACEEGSLGVALESFCSSFLKIGEARSRLSSVVGAMSTQLHQFRREQNQSKRKLELEVSKLRKALQVQEQSFHRAKTKYEKACKEAEQLIALKEKAHHEKALHEVSKLWQRTTDALIAVQESEQQYRAAVEELRSFRASYDAAIQRVLAELQVLEEGRIEYIKALVHGIVDSYIELSNQFAQVIDDLETTVEAVDSRKDINVFVKRHLRRPPEQLAFEKSVTPKIEAEIEVLIGSGGVVPMASRASSLGPIASVPAHAKDTAAGAGAGTLADDNISPVSQSRGSMPAMGATQPQPTLLATTGRVENLQKRLHKRSSSASAVACGPVSSRGMTTPTHRIPPSLPSSPMATDVVALREPPPGRFTGSSSRSLAEAPKASWAVGPVRQMSSRAAGDTSNAGAADEDPVSDDEPYVVKNSGRVDFVRVVFGYEAEEDSELTLRPGDVVQVVEKDGSGWWEGKLADGTIGSFPENYTQAASAEDARAHGFRVDTGDKALREARKGPKIPRRPQLPSSRPTASSMAGKTPRTMLLQKPPKPQNAEREVKQDDGTAPAPSRQQQQKQRQQQEQQEHKQGAASRGAPSKQVIVIFDFEAQDPCDLTIHKREVLTVHGVDDDGGWLDASDAAGNRGMIPANYVREYSPRPDSALSA